MATTTPNYGWSVPTSTDLVKDGATAIETLGDSVDATVKALNPETTLGDIAYRSSTANTNTRLGIGTTGQVLAVSGGVPAWTTPAGGTLNLSQVATGSITGTTLSITGLSSYDTILVMMEGVTHNSGTNTTTYNFRTNTTTDQAAATGAGFHVMTDYSNTQIFAFGDYAMGFNDGKIYPQKHNAVNNTSNLLTCLFTNCKAAGFTTFRATANFQSNMNDSGNTRGAYGQVDGIVKNAAAVSSVQFTNGGGYTMNGGTYYVFAG